MPTSTSAEPDERQRAEDAGQVCHVEQEHLGDGQGDDGGRSEPRRLRAQEEAAISSATPKTSQTAE